MSSTIARKYQLLMVARDEGSCQMCAIAIPAGNVEVCKVIMYTMLFCRLCYLCMYRLLIVALDIFLTCQVKIPMAT